MASILSRHSPLAPALEALIEALDVTTRDASGCLEGALADLLDCLVAALPQPDEAPLGPGWLADLPQTIRTQIRAALPHAPDAVTIARWREGALGLRLVDGRVQGARGKGKHAAGSWATPPDTATRLARLVLSPLLEEIRQRPDAAEHLQALQVLDPACGHGALLLAARDVLAEAWEALTDMSPNAAREQASGQLSGGDIDPWAVRLARLSLGGRARILLRDSLLEPWPGAGEVPFAAVLANPPFMSQMHRDTARDRTRQARLRARWGDAASGHVDEAMLFAVASAKALGPGGRLGILLPETALATRDATEARRAFESLAAPVGLWLAGKGIFKAQVRIVALLARKASAPQTLETWHGPMAAPGEGIPWQAREGHWSNWLADADRVPHVQVTDRTVLASIAQVTADFRDQYYGLVPHVREHRPDDRDSDEVLPLATTGLVDPLACHWGRKTVRFARQTWNAPVVDRIGLERAGGPLAVWLQARLRPKVLVSSQTRILEAFVDTSGSWVPGVPLISVMPNADKKLWLAATAILAPAATAWSLRESAGSGLSSGAIRLPAAKLASLPLPSDDSAWQTAARMAEGLACATEQAGPEAWGTLAELLDKAWGLEADRGLAAWWLARSGLGGASTIRAGTIPQPAAIQPE
ncbi:MAG: N-6 DNA methylase [Candidatus Sericytochromatia bacterium]|nr:N-6 DNA methylase [Candidatus Sericytochromatia bacterium]